MDPRFDSNVSRCQSRDEVDRTLENIFLKLGHEETLKRLDEANIAYAEVNDMKGLSEHDALSRQSVKTEIGPISLIAPPVRFDGQHRTYGAVPSLGQHNTSIRDEFGSSRRSMARQYSSSSSQTYSSNDDDNDDSIAHIRESVRSLCADFPGTSCIHPHHLLKSTRNNNNNNNTGTYWRELDKHEEYPTEFVNAMQNAGYLSILIPEAYGGSGLGLRAACAVLEEIHRSGCNAGAAHAQMYTMGSVLRAGNEEQKKEFLPKVASGELRLQAFGVSEPNNGTDTLSLETVARRAEDGSGDWIVNGQKMWTSRAEHSDLMLLLARTSSPSHDGVKPSKALTTFLVDMRDHLGKGLEIKPVKTMMNHSSTTVFFDDVRIPESSVIGGVGNGFKVILDGMNAERILIASECIGDGRFFVDRATQYACERKVFGRPIGQNQGVQFPIAQAYAELEAAALMVCLLSLSLSLSLPL